MGPGTHVIERLEKGIIPLNRTDAAAMIHDIEYLSPDITEKQADKTALMNSGGFDIKSPLNTLDSTLMSLGFKVKDLFGGYNSLRDKPKYLQAMELLNKPVYQEVIRKYDLKFSPRPNLTRRIITE